MSDMIFKQMQAVQLADLLRRSAGDPILAPQLEERLREAESEIERERRQSGSLFPREFVPSTSTALVLRGGGVEGEVGIRPSLAGASLISYERMFIEQALHDERESAKVAGRQRRPRGAGTPELLFTGTLRGSFGLEFAAVPTVDEATHAVRARALEHVTNAIIAVANGDEREFASAIAPIPAGVLHALKGFFKGLAAHGAEVRLVSSGGSSRQLDSTQIATAAERLDRNVHQEEIKLTGIVRGVTRESGYFDLKVGDDVITGTVAESFSEDDLEAIDRLTNKACDAVLLRTTITTFAGAPKPSYVLLKFSATPTNPAEATAAIGGPAG